MCQKEVKGGKKLARMIAIRVIFRGGFCGQSLAFAKENAEKMRQSFCYGIHIPFTYKFYTYYLRVCLSSSPFSTSNSIHKCCVQQDSWAYVRVDAVDASRWK